MSLQNLLNQFIGSGAESSNTQQSGGGIGGTLNKLSSNIPGGLAGGAAAGGIMALLMTNKSARKVAGKAATYGGAAMLGGLALKAYQNWQGNSQPNNAGQVNAHTQAAPSAQQPAIAHSDDENFQITIMKSMIAAAKSDGHIDADEQQRIFKAVESMELSSTEKGIVFDCLSKDINIDELASPEFSLEMKSEIYLASCLVIELDSAPERTHLDQLAGKMGLPPDLAKQLEMQAQQAFQ